jgi:hypothetical protein
MATARPSGSFAVDVLGPSLVAAVGMSLAFIPSLGTALSTARPEEGGLALGIVNISYQVGSALGLAAMTAVAAAFGATRLDDPVAPTSGFSAAFLGAAGIAAAGALITALTLRIRRPARCSAVLGRDHRADRSGAARRLIRECRRLMRPAALVPAGTIARPARSRYSSGLRRTTN